MLLQQFTRSLTQELTKLHAYEQESCLAGGEGAHPSFASRCRCPLHHPRKQGASGAWLLLDLLPKALGVSWCIPASQSGSLVYTFAVACCSSLWSLSGSSEAAKQSLLQGCRRSSPGLFLASAAAQLPLFLQPRHFHRHRLGVKLPVLNCQRGLPIPAGAGLSWASYKRVESGKWGGSGPSTPTAVPEGCQGK